MSSALLHPVVESQEGRPDETNKSQRPYYAKRPHRKSRAGCRNCKKRKVKCSEERPECRACTLRKEACVYPDVVSKRSAAPLSDSAAVTSPARASPPQFAENDPFQVVFSEPLFRPTPIADADDMKMLWLWTVESFNSFSIKNCRSAIVDPVLKVKVVEHAFRSPFLMDTLMALSALQMETMNRGISPQRAVMYRTRAFAGYRSAIEAAMPMDLPALLACSLLMTALSSHTFRDPNRRRLYIVDWMEIWVGIHLIFNLMSTRAVRESGLSELFYRPPVDLERAATYVPNNLMFMVASIKAGDDDYQWQQVYYDALRHLGSLYMELDHGFGPVLDLRVVTFLTFLKHFVPLGRERRPRALIILAHYLCFTKMTPDVWWLRGIADPEIDLICQMVGNEWRHLLRIPKKVRNAADRTEIASIITDNRNWTLEEEDLYVYERHVDTPGQSDLRLGSELPVARELCRPSPLPPEDSYSTPAAPLMDQMNEIDALICANSPPVTNLTHRVTSRPSAIITDVDEVPGQQMLALVEPSHRQVQPSYNLSQQ
ncbi:hypothetical protein DL764_001449 [Monosporascus ibericus]|uniref:Zn(2)-C6 fungal-type domain-containing protein n=1 Tax=Monosporascus ibericus TaxID=155417 RepID=A0A4Q4TR62_9PEZI|nr:hypothetical protein DL764_001449 [Monosporascus ibericus]